MELVTCVGSAEALKAALRSGADAVRAGLAGFGPDGLPLAELEKAAVYCRVRGVRLYVSMELPLPGSRFQEAADAALRLSQAGADALCLGDLGLVKALRLLLPDMPLHASARLGVHDSTGAALLRSLGASRLLLPPQLSKDDMERIVGRAVLEAETTLYGPGCAAAGACRLSAFTGKGSAAKGDCSQPCRQSFFAQGRSKGVCPALQDISLAAHLSSLREMGVHALCIQGAALRPEYAAMATDVFHRALRDGKDPSPRDLRLLQESFSPGGVSDALFRGEPDQALRDAERPPAKLSLTPLKRGASTVKLLGAVKADYSGGELQRVPVRLRGELRRGAFSKVTVMDELGNAASATGPVPARAGAGKRELSAALFRTQLFNTLDTPYLCVDAQVQAEPGLHLPSVEVSQMRREALQRLTALRSRPPVRQVGQLPPLLHNQGHRGQPDVTVSVSKAAQLSEELAALKPKLLYVPLAELGKQPTAVTPFWENGVTTVCAVLPPQVPDSEALATYQALRALKDIHVDQVLISSLSQLAPTKILGFGIRCGVDMQVFNDRTLRALQEQGILSAILSPELTLREIGRLSKCIETELYAYGRLPLLCSETCLIRASAGGCACDSACVLRDRKGRQYPVLPCKPLKPDGRCRSLVYSPDKLFLVDRLRDVSQLGLQYLHLAFTTENAKECAAVTARYLGLGPYEPNYKTKGLYYENEAGPGFRFSQKTGAAGNAGRL